jgi:hypothetical protein
MVERVCYRYEFRSRREALSSQVGPEPKSAMADMTRTTTPTTVKRGSLLYGVSTG